MDLLCVRNVLAVRPVGAQDGHLLVGLGSEDIDSYKAVRCLQLDCGILLVDIREAVLVHSMQILNFVRHLAGFCYSAGGGLEVLESRKRRQMFFCEPTTLRAQDACFIGSMVTPHCPDGVFVTVLGYPQCSWWWNGRQWVAAREVVAGSRVFGCEGAGQRARG